VSSSRPPPPVDLPIDNAVDLAYRAARVVLDQMLPEGDQDEARRRLATLFAQHRRILVRHVDWRKP